MNLVRQSFLVAEKSISQQLLLSCMSGEQIEEGGEDKEEGRPVGSSSGC